MDKSIKLQRLILKKPQRLFQFNNLDSSFISVVLRAINCFQVSSVEPLFLFFRSLWKIFSTRVFTPVNLVKLVVQISLWGFSLGIFDSLLHLEDITHKVVFEFSKLLQNFLILRHLILYVLVDLRLLFLSLNFLSFQFK